MANEVAYIQSPFNKSKKDKFLMVLSLPQALRDISRKFERTDQTILPDTLQFSIFGAIAPAIEIPAVQTGYAGQTLSHSSHARTPYEPNTVNFTVDNRFNNYWTIYTWLNLLNDDSKGIYDLKGQTVPRPNLDYRANITVYALDEYNKRVAEFLYTDAFPTALGGISYSYRDATDIESSFTFSYSQLIFKPIFEIESL
jgi:hypothetical protein